MQHRRTFQLHSVRSRVDGCLASGTGRTFSSRDRPLHQWRPLVVSERVGPLLVSNTVGVGTCPLEQATQTGSSASIGDAQSESESSGPEAPLPARDRASELPETTAESLAPGDVAQATCPAVWAPRHGSRAPCGSGRPLSGLEHPSARPRARHDLQGEESKTRALCWTTQSTSSSSPGSRNSGFGARHCLFSTSVISIGRHSTHHRSMRLAVPGVQSAGALSVTARRRIARSCHRLSRRDRSADQVPLGQLP